MNTFARIVLMFLLLAPAVFAADTWTSVRSRNFVVVGDADEQDMREIAENLERFREVVLRIMPRAISTSSVGTTVILFRNNSALEPFKPLYQGKPADVAGYFQSGPDMNFIVLRADQDAPRVIYHEYVHLLTMDSMSYAPPWFREGIAEYYSTFRLTGSDQKVRIGQAINEHILQLRQAPLFPLEVLLSVGRDSPQYNESDKQGTFYAQSWALVHYLLLGDDRKRQPQVAPFLTMLADGRSVRESFETVFQTQVETFQRSFEQYIRNQAAWPTLEYTFTDPVNVASDTQVRAVSEAEAQFHMGDLLLHSDRLPEAEAYLRRAIQLDPQLASAQASLGMLLVGQKKYAEAFDYLKRAANASSSNFLIHYYYAEMLQKQSIETQVELSDENFQILQAELRKAIQLAPQYVPALELLAYVNLSRYQNPEESITLLREALDISPGRDNVKMLLAQLLVDRGEREEAREILRPLALNSSADTEIRGSAQKLLDYMEKSSGILGFSEILPEINNETPPPAATVTNAPDGILEEPKDLLERVDLVAAPVEGEIVEGVLTNMDCSDGMTLSVSRAGRTVKLHTSTPGNIQFVSYTSTVASSITCGPTAAPGIPVRITYKPGLPGPLLGEPLVVAFTEKN